MRGYPFRFSPRKPRSSAQELLEAAAVADVVQGFRRALLAWIVLQVAALLVLVFWRVRPPKAAA